MKRKRDTDKQTNRETRTQIHTHTWPKALIVMCKMFSLNTVGDITLVCGK